MNNAASMNITGLVLAALITAGAAHSEPQPPVTPISIAQQAASLVQQVHKRAESKITERDIVLCAKLLWGEARGVKSKAEQAAVIWCVLNRIDAGYANTIEGVITARGQFTGYRKSNPVTDELYGLSRDVLIRYYLEREGVQNTGRTLPSDYLWFTGYKGRNRFRNKYRGGKYWDWSLDDPYMER